MTDFLINAHDGWQYIALLGVVFAVGWSFRKNIPWTDATSRPYTLAAIAVDIQVALGILVWIFNSGWDAGLAQGWIHPIAGLGALGAIHAFLGRAREAGDESGHKIARTGFLIGLVLVIVAIGLGEVS